MNKLLIHIEFVVFVDDDLIKHMYKYKMSTLILEVKDNKKSEENKQKIENKIYEMVNILNEIY
jgi:uncharacterized membrane protein YkgB